MTAMQLLQHPLSAAFPSMPESEIEALAIDIEKHGQREKGVIFEGMVLDGWHRNLACHKAGVPFKTEDFDGDDPVAFVISRNLHRRHLTASQRAAAVVATSEWRGRGEKLKSAPGAGLTEKQMAETAEVSERTIRQAKTAHDAGLGDKVKDGTVSAKRAAEVAKLPKGQREKALRENKPPKEKKADPRDAELKRLSAALAEANEQKADVADVARELEDKLTVFETTDPDDQQKEIQKLQKRIVRLEAEVQRLTVARNDCQNKNNELIRQVKMLQKKNGR